MKKYSELTIDELAAITDLALYEAVCLEAAERGIAMPLPAKDLQLVQYSLPKSGGRKLYELLRTRTWGSPETTGLYFTTEEAAIAAMANAVAFKDIEGKFTVATVYLDAEECEPVKRATIKEPDTDEFDDLYKEAREAASEAYSEVSSREYRKRQWVNYLDLAKGDTGIARAFWDKINSAPPPTVTDEELAAHRAVIQGAREANA